MWIFSHFDRPCPDIKLRMWWFIFADVGFTMQLLQWCSRQTTLLFYPASWFDYRQVKLFSSYHVLWRYTYAILDCFHSEKHLCDAVLVWLAANIAKSEGWGSSNFLDKVWMRYLLVSHTLDVLLFWHGEFWIMGFLILFSIILSTS